MVYSIAWIPCLISFYPSQAVDFELADKSGDPDPMSWTPATAAIPGGIMFPDLNGHARLDMMWEVPAQVRLNNAHAMKNAGDVAFLIHATPLSSFVS